jgi:hypothetical protein
MGECIHCESHDLLDSHFQEDGANLADVAAKVTEVLADLVILAAPEDRAMLTADILANLGHFILEKTGEAAEPSEVRHRH